MSSIKYELVTRARRGDLCGVKRLIQKGVHVDAKNRNNQTALYCACERGHISVARYLLDNGASVDFGEKLALIAAARYDHYDCVELLLQHNADVNCTNTELETPMSVALQKRHYFTILLLLQYNAIPPTLISDHVAMRLLELAEEEHTEAIQKLVDDKIIDLTSKNTFLAAFKFAFQGSGSVELAERIILNDSYPKIEQHYPYAAYYSAKNNWSTLLSNLFQKGVDVNAMTKGRTPLYAACKKGHESVVSLLLNNGADPNVSLPLHIVVQQRNAVILNKLFEKGAKIDQSGEPLLHIACNEAAALETAGEAGDARHVEQMSIITQLLQQRVDVNAISDKGDTALYRACKSGRLRVVQFLLKAGADVNLTSKRRYPLIAACKAGNIELINVLVKTGADVKCSDSKNKTCLHAFVNAYTSTTSGIHRHEDSFSVIDIKNTFALLLESGVDVNAHCSLGETALYQASKAGQEHIMRLVLETRADTTDSTRRRLLHAACERGYAQIVDMLLQRDTDPNASTVSGSSRLPVFRAVMKGYTHIVDLLLKCGADADKQGQSGGSALICFIELLASQMCKASRVVEPLNERNLNILRNMLLLAEDVNKSDLDGRNALHIASSFGMCDVIMELMKRGANCNHLTFLGESALDLACENDHKAAVEILLQNGAKPDRDTATRPTYHQFGFNPQKSAMPVLCRAAEKGSETIVRSLLQYGADVNACDKKGNTALHLATSLSVVEILLNVGAKVNVANNNADTPLCVLCKKPQTDASVVEMLLKSGADPNVGFLLHAVCENNDADTVRLLLSYGCDANQLKLVPRASCMYGVGIEPSPLCIACRKRNVDMVVFLLRNGADVAFADTDSRGNGLLHFAVEGLEERANSEEYDPIITLLLQHNAAVNVVSSTGETALYMACMKGLTNVVKLLLICGAHISLTKSDSKKYPLLIACQNKFRDIAMLLLERGADANVQSIEGETPLKFAAANGDVALVNQLIAYGADPCQMQNIGDTALHAAIRQCKSFVGVNSASSGAEINGPLCLVSSTSDTVNTDVVQTLLEHGADPNVVCPPCSVWSPSSWYQSLPLLSVTASCGNSALVLLLIKFGARLDHTDEFGGTALHFAIGYGKMTFFDELGCVSTNSDTSTVEILLSAGADVNVLDISGSSPLFLACDRGKTEFVKLLLSRGADPNNGSRDKLPIHAACSGLHYESAKLLLEYKADVTACDDESKTALHHALESIMCRPNPDNDKNAALVQLLLEAGVNVNAKFQNGESPIYVVCAKGLTTIATKMLDCKAVVDIDSGRKLPLIAACRNKNVPVVQLLLNRGADPNVQEEGNVSLHISVTEDNSELVQLLLKHGANVGVADTEGNTALHLAVRRCKPRASSRYADAFSSEKSNVDILLENKADVNALNGLGETPLYRAVARELLDVVGKMLQAYGANPNAGSPDKSPLVAACQKENAKLVDMLLHHGADPNLHEASASCDLASNHKLPLFIAADTCNTDIMTSLLNAGASVNATNREGRNAVCLAAKNLTIASCYSSKKKRILSAVRLLLQHGANFNTPDGHSPLHPLVDLLSIVAIDNRHSKYLLELLQLMIEHGAMLLDSSSQLENIIGGLQSSSTRTLAHLATFNGKHKFIVDLFRAGAGFQLIASCCMEVAVSMAAKSVTLCQAVVLAGYVPSSEELVKLRQAAANENRADGVLKQLVDWLNEDRQQVPSLFRQCRVAIRRQLSTVTQYRTILPAIDELPLPNDVKLYLQFDGQMTEVDLGVGNDEQQPQSGETTDSDDTSVDSPYSSEQSDSENDSDSEPDYTYDSDDDNDVSGSDYYNGSDSDQDLS